MRTRFFALTAALILTLVPSAYARGTGAAVSSDWASVQAIAPGAEIAVRLKDGDRLTGRFDSATDRNISFTHDGHKVSLTRESIRLVQINRGKSRLNGALMGAAIGGAGGFGFGAWVHSYGDFNSSVI
jgi:hypothetical protein